MGRRAGTYREGQINPLDRMQNKAAKFAANRTNVSVWETLAQHRKTARICALFKAFTGERAWKSIGDSLKGPCCLSRDDHDRKNRAREQQISVNTAL